MYVLTDSDRSQLATWVVNIGILVAFLASIQVGGGLSAFISHKELLYFAKGLEPTGLMIVSGMIIGPVSVSVLMVTVTYRSHTMDTWKHMVSGLIFLWAAVLLIGILNLACSIYCLCLWIIQTGENGISIQLKKAMDEYHKNNYYKTTVDILQETFQCCGLSFYTDWFRIDWQGTNFFPGSGFGRDAVPFSCCSISYHGPCIQAALKVENVASINAQGCVGPFLTATSVYLSVVGFLFFFCAFLQIVLVILIRLLQTATCNAINMEALDKPSVGYIWFNKQDSYQQLTDDPNRQICSQDGAPCKRKGIASDYTDESYESSSILSADRDLDALEDGGGRSSLELNKPHSSRKAKETGNKRSGVTPKSSKNSKKSAGSQQDFCFCSFRSDTGVCTPKKKKGAERGAIPKKCPEKDLKTSSSSAGCICKSGASSKHGPGSSKSTDDEQDVARLTPSDHSEHKLSCYCKKKLGLT